MIGLNAGTIKVTEWSTGNGEPPPAPDPGTLVSLTSYEVARAVAGTVEQIIDKDAIINRTTGTTLYRDQQMQLSYLGELESPIVWTSSDESVATVDSDGFVTHLTTGTTTITATAGVQSLQKVLNLTVSTPSIADELVDYVAGSLAKSVSDAIDNLLEGKNATTALKLFTTQDHVTPTYVRNGDFWGASLGNALCAISPWNTSGGPTRAGVAISDLHILFAAHYQIGLGATVRFVLADNTVVSRTLVSRLTHPEYAGPSTGYAHDLTVGLLESPLPAGVVPVKILPDNYKDYLPSLSSQRSLPALCLDQEEKGLVTDLVGLSSMATFSYPNRVNWEKRAEFYESKISGDSGNPAFLIVDDQLVLLTCWTFGGAGQGTSVVADAAMIQSLMNSLGGNRTLSRLTTADLSGYKIYAGYDPDVIKWRNEVIDAGGVTNATTLAAVQTMVTGLKVDGVWPKITDLGLFLDSLTLSGSMVKIKGSGLITNNGFVAGDLSAAGLKGSGSKYLDTGVLITRGNVSMSAYLTEAPTSAANALLLGTLNDNSDFTGLGRLSAGSSDIWADSGNGVPDGAKVVAVPRDGFFFGSSEGPNLRKLYRNGGLSNTNTNTGSGTARTKTVGVYQAIGHTLSASSSRIALYHIGTSMTATDVSNLSLRVNALMTSLGINVYTNP